MLAMAEVRTKPLPIRATLVALVALCVGVAVGLALAGSDAPNPPAQAPSPQATGQTDGLGATSATSSPEAEVQASQFEVMLDHPCGYGPLGDGEILSISTGETLYLAMYDEQDGLVGCVLESEGTLLWPPVWSFDGQRAAWVDGDQVELWERSTGARGSVPHAAQSIVGAPQGFAYWDDEAEEIVEVSPIPEHFPVRTPVQAQPDGWIDCDRENGGCISVGLQSVVDTGNYIFMHRDPGGTMRGSIWLSRVTADGNAWTYPNEFDYPDGVVGFNILGEVEADHEAGIVHVVTGFSCGSLCSTPSYSVAAIDLETGERMDSPFQLPDPPPERVWLVEDLDAAVPSVVSLGHLPNGQWYYENAFPEFASSELFTHEEGNWERTGFVAHTADRSATGLIAFADEGAFYLFGGTDAFPHADDLIGRWEGEVTRVEWAPPAIVDGTGP